MIHPEQERVRKLLTEAVTLLCRNSLQFEEEVVIEGLIGITLDRSDILLINIQESVKQALREISSSGRSDKAPIPPGSPGKRKRRKRSQDSDSDAPTLATPPVKKPAPSATDSDDSRPDPERRLHMDIKKENPEYSQDHNDRNSSQKGNDPDGRTIHPAHDSSCSQDNNQIAQNSYARVKQENSGSNHSPAQPAPDEQTLPPGGVRVKEEVQDEPEECFVIDSDEDDMSNSSASNSMSLNMLENQLQMASQNWASVDDGSGFDLSNLAQQGQGWPGQFDMSGQQMGGGDQGDMSFMGSPQPGTSQDPQKAAGMQYKSPLTLARSRIPTSQLTGEALVERRRINREAVRRHRMRQKLGKMASDLSLTPEQMAALHSGMGRISAHGFGHLASETSGLSKETR